jgi:hypothetical protein
MAENIFVGTGKRFASYAFYLKKTYGGRIAKVPLDGGFTCPNRDGTKGIGGCIYCSARGSGDFIAHPSCSLYEQFEAYASTLSEKWTPIGYIPYFQSFTGTYAPPHRLRALYAEALSLPHTVGLSVATRPDCINDSVCEVLSEFAEQTDLTIELGVQTIWDKTASDCNLCHNFADTLQAVHSLQKLPLQICVHLMNGLPGETHEQMVTSAQTIGELGIDAVKIHLLHVLRGTSLASRLDYSCLTQAEYISIVCDQLEVLPPSVVIQRLTGDGRSEDLLAPAWSRRKREVLNGIDQELKRRNSWQGKRI